MKKGRAMIIPPKRLIISGGGIRVIAHVGAIKELSERGYLKQVREYVGVSAGALLSTMFCLKYTIKQVEEICLGLDFSVIRSLDPESAFNIFETYGCDDGANLDRAISSVFRIRGYIPELTFGQAADLGLHSLRIYAADLNTSKLIEYSAKKTPHTEIKFALRASMCIPVYFQPLVDPDNGHLLVDGGLICNYPINQMTNKEIEESLGLKFNSKIIRKEKFEGFMEFINQLLGTYYSPRISLPIKYKCRTITVPCGEYPSWNFEASAEDRRRLIEIGRSAVVDFIENKMYSYKGLRRYSVS
jgi:predicted acylesterase/phospholipase RssA